MKNRTLPNIQAFILADTVIHDQRTDKKTIVGLFTGWRSETFPFQTRPFDMFIQLHGLYGKIQIQIRLVSLKDNRVIVETSKLATPVIKSKNHTVDFVLSLAPIKFKSPGVYAFEIYVGENELLKDYRVEVVDLKKKG